MNLHHRKNAGSQTIPHYSLPTTGPLFFSFEFVPRLLESDESSNNQETLLTTPATVTEQATTTKAKKTTKKSRKRKKPKGMQTKKQAEMGIKPGKNRQLLGSLGTFPPTTTMKNGLMGDDTTLVDHLGRQRILQLCEVQETCRKLSAADARRKLELELRDAVIQL